MTAPQKNLKLEAYEKSLEHGYWPLSIDDRGWSKEEREMIAECLRQSHSKSHNDHHRHTTESQ
jgi:hypothetical protein